MKNEGDRSPFGSEPHSPAGTRRITVVCVAGAQKDVPAETWADAAAIVQGLGAVDHREAQSTEHCEHGDADSHSETNARPGGQ
jgi:hypothetical protein